MKIQFFLLLIVLLINFCIINAYGSTHIVGLNDEYEYKTIQSAVDSAKKGDRILISSGTYYESIIVTKDDLIFEGVDKLNPPIITGCDKNFYENPTHNWVNIDYEKNGEKLIYKTSYTWYKSQPSDMDFTSYNGGYSRSALQVYEDDEFLRGYRNRNDPDYTIGVSGAYRSIDELDYDNDNGLLPSSSMKNSLQIPGRFYYDENNSELYIWSADELHPNTHKYYIPVRFHIFDITNYKGITLRNLVIKHSEGYAVKIYDSGNVTVENCFFISSRFDIYIQRSSSIRISNCFFQDKGFWERYWYDDCKGTILWGGKIRITGGDESMDIEIDHNSFHGSYSFIHPNIGETSIHDNIFSHGGSESDTCCEKRIFKNIFHHVDDNSLGLSNVDENSGPIYVYRNLWYASNAMIKDGGTLMGDSKCNKYIYHNTFVAGKMISHHPYPYPPYKTTVFRNNIFYMRYRTMESYWYYTNKDPANDWSYFPFTNGIDSDYNLFYRKPYSDWPVIARFRLTTDPELQSYYDGEFEKMCTEQGIDNNSFEIDPSFKNNEEISTMDVLNININTFSNMNYKNFIIEGYEKLFKKHFKEIFEHFTLLGNTTAKDNGITIPDEWPDVFEKINDGKPDIGCIELGQPFFDYDDENIDTIIIIIISIVATFLIIAFLFILILFIVFVLIKSRKVKLDIVKSELDSFTTVKSGIDSKSTSDGLQ